MTYPIPPQPQPWMPPPVRRRPRHPEAKLERLTWRDAVTVTAYVLLMFVGVGALLMLSIPGVPELFNGDVEAALFASNLFSYVVMFALVLWAAGPELWKSFKTFRWYPWAKYLCIPGSWIVTIITSAVILSVYAQTTGLDLADMQQSANQQAANELISAIPFPLMVLMVVVLGPLVEEFVFRHLLVGKLSRWVNPWILVVVSALAFMSLHFIGKEWPTVMTATPYVVMGIAFGAGYVLSGKSLGYAWVMHAFSNLMALSLSSLLAPMLPAGG